MQSFLSKSLFSKILATENINFKISKEARTASFNYKSRELELPDWDTSNELERLLISHEVAHALFTDSVKRMAFIESYPKDFQKYAARGLNYIEDSRIEKLIMRKYPGLVKDYVAGYKELDEVFLFFKNGPYDNIWDKLNHHFKMVVSGKHSNIYNFDSVEQDIVNRMLKLESYDDTLELTRELLELYGDQISASDTSSTFELSLEGDIDIELEAELEEAANKKANKDERPPINLINYTLNTVSTSRYIGKYERKGSNTYDTTSKVVQYMNAVFKKKMNARGYASQVRRKTGDIDSNSLYRYKYDEKIFESKTLRSKQKNHAVILLVDGSGSMNSNMKSVSIQARNMADFCRLAKIPFRCFVFQDIGGSIITGFPQSSRVKLNEFFHTGSNYTVETVAMGKMASGGTPLSESLVALMQLVEEMKSKYDVLNLMVITDGACNSAHKHIQNLRFKNICISSSDYGDSVPTSILKIYRDYYGVNVISFDLGDHPCYNSHYNQFGVDVHFEVPLSYVNNPENSRKFLDELVSVISK